jgi:hypothetical protein
MQSCSTYDDVNLILKLYEIRREQRMREARAWFAKSFRAATLEEFNTICPPGSEENSSFRQVTTYWEMVASFVNGGVLQKDLFFESGRELLVVWVRLEPLLAELRQAFSDPTQFGNLEKVAKDFIACWEERAPGAYEAFRGRIA